MKILHIHTKMAGGGIEAMICGLVNRMVDSHDLTLCTIFEPDDTDVFYGKVSNKVRKMSLGKNKPGFSINIVLKVFKLIWKGNFDVVHLHGFFYYYFLAVILLHGRTRFVYTIHSDARMENVSWDKHLYKIKKFCFRHTWMYPVTISPTSKKSFSDFYSCDSTMILNGVEPLISHNSVNNIRNEFNLPDSTNLFIHPGRITLAKNQVVLCKTFKRLLSEGYDVALIIAGGIQDTEIFEQLKHYFSDRILYIGERTDVQQIMNSCVGFCLPSIWEGLPISLLEAMSVGCIPICSPVGGIIDVIDDSINGFISNSSSEEDYYKCVKLFLSKSPKELDLVKHNCIETFEPYKMSNVVEKYLDLYHRIQ